MDDYLSKLARALLDIDFNNLSPRKKQIIESIAEEVAISKDINLEFDRELTYGERVADKVAKFGGSWTFIGCAVVVLSIWMGINSYYLVFSDKPFDPYPFILLNLGLSMLAAFQAPIILMTQNRQTEKDRLKVENNFKVTLKMELELIRLHQRLDRIEEALNIKQNGN